MKRAALVLLPVLLVAWLIGAILLDQRHAHLSASLVQAVNSHDATQVEALLAQGADPNARDWKTYYPGGRTPFVPPWYEKYLAKLMRRKPRPADPYVGPTALMIAADDGDTAIAQSLLDHGADTTKTGSWLEYDDQGTRDYIVPPLWEAVQQCHAATVKLLIQRGAPVNYRNNGLTPLLLTDNLEVATALIQGGADVNAVSDDLFFDGPGETQLFRAIKGEIGYEGYSADLALARLLLSKGANVDAGDGAGETPLMAACERGSLESAKLLLSRGANVNARDQWGRSALLYSVPDMEMFPLLLAHGTDLNAPDNDGKTALMSAAEGGQMETLTFLLAHGAAVNAQDHKGETALMLASCLNYSGLSPDWHERRQARLRLLRQYGANPGLKDRQGRTAASYFNPNPPEPPGS